MSMITIERDAASIASRSIAEVPAGWTGLPSRRRAPWRTGPRLSNGSCTTSTGRSGSIRSTRSGTSRTGSYPTGLAGYVDLYGASVTGGRRADVKARFAGPALSDWLSPTTGSGLFLPAFLAEAGRRGLPVDAITCTHSIASRSLLRPRRAPHPPMGLGRGDDRAVPLIVDEWNIAATPPYPEGDLNASEAGAAFVAASLIAINRHGLGPQAFQMIADPGQPGYSGGAFTVAGLPRPSLPVFESAGRCRAGPSPSRPARNGPAPSGHWETMVACVS